MAISFRLVLFMLVSIQGCSYSIHTKKLTPPLERDMANIGYFSSIESDANKPLEASIGDELFIMNRYITGKDEIVVKTPQTKKKFPAKSTWTGTHTYNDGISGNLIVYTTPDYYHGEVGVILDSNEKLATSHPVVQLKGLNKGRRWKVIHNYDNAFFKVPLDNIDSWALRYGGKNDGKHIFEIVKKYESSTREVLQTIYINEKDFLNGFVIRKVLITGLKSTRYGLIEYKISDTMK